MPFILQFGGRLDIHKLSILLGMDLHEVAVAPGQTGLGAAKFNKAVLLLDVGGPTEFNLENGSVIEPDLPHRKIFHVEDAPLDGIPETTMDGIRLPPLLIGKLAERVAADRDRYFETITKIVLKPQSRSGAAGQTGRVFYFDFSEIRR